MSLADFLSSIFRPSRLSGLGGNACSGKKCPPNHAMRPIGSKCWCIPPGKAG